MEGSLTNSRLSGLFKCASGAVTPGRLLRLNISLKESQQVRFAYARVAYQDNFVHFVIVQICHFS